MPTEGEPGQEEQQMEWGQRGGQGRGEGEVVGQEGEGRGSQSPSTEIPGEDEARLVYPRDLTPTPPS